MFKKVVSLCLSAAVAMSLGVVAGAEMPKIETFSKEQCEDKCKEIVDLEKNLKNKKNLYNYKGEKLNMERYILKLAKKDRKQAKNLKSKKIEELNSEEDPFFIRLLKEFTSDFDPEVLKYTDRIEMDERIIKEEKKNIYENERDLTSHMKDINRMQHALNKINKDFKKSCASRYPCKKNKIKEEL